MMKRHELAKVLLDEIVRARAQLVSLRMVLARRAEERKNRMVQCEECEHLWKAYQKATIQSVQLHEEIRAMTEDQGLQELSETTTGPRLPNAYARRPGKAWPNIRRQPGLGECAFVLDRQKPKKTT
jgi:hypothetical protein